MMAGNHPHAERRARLDAAVSALRARVGEIPAVAVVLGSGLGGFVERLADRSVVPYRDLPFWPQTGVSGHAGEVVAGTVAGRSLLVLSGRAHLYEGHDPDTVAFPVRVLARAGVRMLVVTNAAGGINARLSAGALMVIDDHLNFTGHNPLVGPNDPDLGTRFPDMSEVYSRRLRTIADGAANAAGIPLEHGIYIGVLGPSYETPAEIRAFRTMGADAVGMSTVIEAITARHVGMEVLGLSCIANAAAGMNDTPLVEEDVLATTRRAHVRFAGLVEGILERL